MLMDCKHVERTEARRILFEYVEILWINYIIFEVSFENFNF